MAPDATPTGPGDGGGDAEAAIEVLVRENRTFPPSEDFVAQALINDRSVYVEAERDYEGFWLERAKEFVEWFKEPTESLQWDPPHCTPSKGPVASARAATRLISAA